MSHNDKTWNLVSQNLTSTGGTDGTVQIASTAGFFTNQHVFLAGGTNPTLDLKVLNVMDAQNLRLGVWDTGRNNSGIDLSAYTVSITSKIFAPEQKKDSVDASNIVYYTYQSDPVSAVRVWPATTPASIQYARVGFNSIVTANSSATAATAIMTVTSDVKIVKILNSLNQDVSITYNGVEKFRLEAGEDLDFDLYSTATTWPAGTLLGVYQNGVIPTAGSLRVILTS